jgi:cytidylate kinase
LFVLVLEVDSVDLVDCVDCVDEVDAPHAIAQTPSICYSQGSLAGLSRGAVRQRHHLYRVAKRKRALVITVDGPAAAGKSTVARALARRLGYQYLDTGAMYRAATLKALSAGVDMQDAEALARAVADCRIELALADGGMRVLCDGKDVTAAIRSTEVTQSIYRLADQPAVRRMLIEQQRAFARGRDVVAEGRDQGTEVFPDAAVKFYLDASLKVRARRRLKDMAGSADLQEVMEQMADRDTRDRRRPMGALRQTDDMVCIDSTEMSVDEVVEAMLEAIERRGARRAPQER